MAVTAKLVKELRLRTGAGMMECKKALVKTSGDIEKAIEEMRKSGQAKADKKASRTAAEGLIVTKQNGKNAIALEVNCETDFVAKDVSFKAFSNSVADLVLEKLTTNIDEISNSKLENGQTVEEAKNTLIAKIGEKISVRRAYIIKNSNNVGVYNHSGRIGVLIDVVGGDSELSKDLAMQVAASRPIVVSANDVPQNLVDKEMVIFKAQTEALRGKKADNIIEKIIFGKVNKFKTEQSLEGQLFVKDPSIKVANLLKSKKAKVNSFIRIEVGEGIEKKTDNFAEEVKAQAFGK